MKSLLVFLAAILTVIDSESQVITVHKPPVNSPHDEAYPVLLPDSSLLLVSNRKDNSWRAYRFALRNRKWVESPSQLDSMINSTMVKGGVPAVRFSADFTMLFLTHQDGDVVRFFESNFIDGRWRPFVEFFKGNPKGLWQGITVMPDHRTAFASSGDGKLYTFYKTDDGWDEPDDVFPLNVAIKEIQHPVAFGVNSLLFEGKFQRGGGKERTFFTSKMIAWGKWTEPVKVDGMSASYTSLCWNRESYLFAAEVAGHGTGLELLQAPLPPLIRSEMAEPGQTIGEADFLKSQLINLGPPINTPQFEGCPVLLPDSSLLLTSNRRTAANKYEYKAYRFVNTKHNIFKNIWVETPSQLDSMINTATLAAGMPSCHFSPDYTMVVVTIAGGDSYVRFFESHLVDGRWQPFLEFFAGNPKKLRADFAIMNDHHTAFATDRNGTLYTFQRTADGWTEPVPVNAFKHAIGDIEYIFPIGEKGLLFGGVIGGRKGAGGHFFSKMIAPGKWSVPEKVEGIGGFHVSPCWNRQSFLLAGRDRSGAELDIRVAPLPPLLRREMVLQPRTKGDPAPAATGAVAATPITVTATPDVPRGRYFAVLIGNADYKEDKLDLVRPTQDVDKMFTCLSTKYGFEEKNIVRVVNADRNTILKELYALRQKVNASDNLLIFYAGHGNWDDHIKQGYWWPSDAAPDNPATWISNSDLREQIRGLKTKHTLLISDACFSGGIFRMRGAEEIRNADLDIQQLYKLSSRRAITSGALTSVPDESVFVNYMLKTLNENQEKYLPSTRLFSSFRRAVMNNSLTTPQDGVILDAGDEGGDFVFIRK